MFRPETIACRKLVKIVNFDFCCLSAWNKFCFYSCNLQFESSLHRLNRVSLHVAILHATFILWWMPTIVNVSMRYNVYNGNWTEWSAIWAEIIRVISKSNERAVRVQFEITNMISGQNCTTRNSITTLLQAFWNRPNTGFGQLKYFIDVVLSWFEIKFIHFLWGEIRVLEICF